MPGTASHFATLTLRHHWHEGDPIMAEERYPSRRGFPHPQTRFGVWWVVGTLCPTGIPPSKKAKLNKVAISDTCGLPMAQRSRKFEEASFKIKSDGTTLGPMT
jgi:hypothetical protein